MSKTSRPFSNLLSISLRLGSTGALRFRRRSDRCQRSTKVSLQIQLCEWWPETLLNYRRKALALHEEASTKPFQWRMWHTTRASCMVAMPSSPWASIAWPKFPSCKTHQLHLKCAFLSSQMDYLLKWACSKSEKLPPHGSIQTQSHGPIALILTPSSSRMAHATYLHLRKWIIKVPTESDTNSKSERSRNEKIQWWSVT